MSLQTNCTTTFCLALTVASAMPCLAGDYPIVDTGQERCFDNRLEIEYPKPGKPFFGQDAQYQGNRAAYRDNGDGTITDLVTELMWQKNPGPKKTFKEAVAGASTCKVGGHLDWRLPSIKELYSLILFSGEDVDPESTDTAGLKPFINTKYLGFVYGDPAKGERVIDSQMATSTKYVSTTMHGNETMFGVNFADGRIKGYPTGSGRRRGPTKYYVLYVRGNTDYGKNDFHDNGNGTITDRATGLCWAQVDSGHLKAGEKKDGKLNWEEALRWAEGLEYAGHSDWRLPNAKELQSIVDYKRSPDTTESAAIDPVFRVTPIRDGLGKVNYPFYWSSTTHKRMDGGEAAAYVAFGRSQGWMPGRTGEHELLDVHGAGSQRSDPKAGDPSRFPRGRGPQGDVIQIYNVVRPVRGGKASLRESGPELAPQPSGRRQGGPGKRGLARKDSGKGESGRERPEGGNPKGSSARFVKRLDRDGDGKVSRQEFRGPSRAFDRNDRNGDGYLSEDEAPNRQRQEGRPGGTKKQPGGRRGQQQGREGGAAPQGKAMVTAEEAGAAAASASVRADAKWQKLPPSFVLILADDMGWTGLSVASDERMPGSKSDFYQTPRVESLAREGMRFSNAYAPAPMCTPTRASLLTGKSPAQLHMTTPGPADGPVENRKLIPPRHVDALPTAETTIAEVLRQRNYATAHFGKWHLSGGGPGQHGFDRHDGETGNQGPGAYTDPNPKDTFGVTSRAMSFMEEQVAAGKPFYVQLSHYALHQPTQALRSTEKEFADVPAGRNHRDVAYAAMTKDLDTSVGMVLKKIQSLDIAKNTYVVFMSDNGAGRGQANAPLAGGKASLKEGGIRVPLIVRGPGVPAGSSCHESVIGYDLFPTICELAGRRSSGPSELEGTSIVPLLHGKAAFERDREELIFHFPHYGKGPRQVPQSAIRMGNFKLLRNYETDDDQLFDLANDMGERTDLALKMPDKKKDFSARLDAYLARIKAQLPTVNPNYDPTKETNKRRR
ncbi:MAG: sulfatase-like hydrolase/transferase [Planctomycetota bacterium]|jgi:arylsulfatase A-like enzyme|nr:sulfatase-like hydrolase/transferase [Planctomycetota bacterium]